MFSDSENVEDLKKTKYQNILILYSMMFSQSNNSHDLKI